MPFSNYITFISLIFEMELQFRCSYIYTTPRNNVISILRYSEFQSWQHVDFVVPPVHRYMPLPAHHHLYRHSRLRSSTRAPLDASPGASSFISAFIWKHPFPLTTLNHCENEAFERHKKVSWEHSMFRYSLILIRYFNTADALHYSVFGRGE